MKLIKLGVIISFAILSERSLGQSVGVGTTSPNENAALHVVSPNSNQGILIPSVTNEQRTSEDFISNLSSTENGLLVYDLTDNNFYFWANDAWLQLVSGDIINEFNAGVGIEINELDQIVNTGDTDSTDDITTSTVAGGVLEGTYPDPVLAEGAVETNSLADLSVTNPKIADNTVRVEKIAGLADPTSGRNSLMITNNSNLPRWFQPSINQVLVTDNAGQITSRPESSFEREDLPTGYIYIGDNNLAEAVDVSDIGNILVGNGTTLELLDASGNGRILVGNGTSLVSVDVMGDISVDGTGTTQISADAVASAEISDGSISSDDLANQSVTADKIANDAIQSLQIQDASITVDDLAVGSVNSSAIANGAIVNADINSSAGISVSKIELLNTGEIVFGNSGVATIGALAGDASIDGSGNLLLGSTNTIDINSGTIDGTPIGDTNPSTAIFTSLSATDGSNIAALNADNLNLGTVPNERLPSIGANNSFGGGTDVIQSMTVDEQGRVTTVVAGPPPSDRRLKENIHLLNFSPSRLNQLQAYNYEWKDKKWGKETQVGLIAQDVEQLYPELVKTRSDGYKGITYQGFIPILIEAAKSQFQQLNSLTSVNANLQNRIKLLENRVEGYQLKLEKIEKMLNKIEVIEQHATTDTSKQSQ